MDTPAESHQVTKLLKEMRQGKSGASEALLEIVYKELRRLAGHYMRFERKDHTLQPTALVHEAYLKIVGGGPVDWQDRTHFFALASRQMRRILVDYARRHEAEKRGGGGVKVTLDKAAGIPADREESIMAVDDALERLGAIDARAVQVVEMKFFGGMTDQQVAQALGISFAAVRRDWDFAKAWLLAQLGREGG